MIIDRSILGELVEKDFLNIKEVELFKTVDRWAEIECERPGLVTKGSVKRRILGERIVKGVSFPLMEEKEFASVVLDCNILSKKEYFYGMKYFNSVLPNPVGFSGERRTSQQKCHDCYFIGQMRCLSPSPPYLASPN